MDTFQAVTAAAGLGLLAGIRLYFTAFALGLAIRFGWFQPHDAGSSLAILAQTPVLIGSGMLFAVEFLADKIPWLDSIWDGVHTFIRPIGAAALGMTALGSFDPAMTTIIGLVSGGLAFTGHASKAATRVAINHSPEPFSNWIVSFAEDLFVPFGLWVVLEHPVIAAVVITAFLIVFVILARAVFRLFRSTFRRFKTTFGRVEAGT